MLSEKEKVGQVTLGHRPFQHEVEAAEAAQTVAHPALLSPQKR